MASARPTRYHARCGKKQEERQRFWYRRPPPQGRALRDPPMLNTPMGRRRVSFYGATAKEANNKKFQAFADQDKGILFSDPGRLTVGEYLQSWLTDTAHYQVSEATFERYERTCCNHLVPFFGRLRLRELTAAHVRAFKARKIEEGLNPNTVGVMQGVLSTALNQVVDDNLIPSNPAGRVKKAVKREQVPMRYVGPRKKLRGS